MQKRANKLQREYKKMTAMNTENDTETTEEVIMVKRSSLH